MTRQYMYSDVDIYLYTQTDGDVKRNTGIEAVKNSLINIIKTRPGSRRMLPEFAGYFHNLLFEPVDEITARELGYNLVEAIRIWDDRVIIENVNIVAIPDKNMYECTLTFKVKESNKTEEIRFVLMQN